MTPLDAAGQIMGISTTILFYLLFGAGVSASVAIVGDRESRGGRVFRVLTALLFWPLYVPALLWRPGASRSAVEQPLHSNEPVDPLAAAIQQVEKELDAATQSLDGWAEDVLLLEQDRFSELRAAWRTQAGRIRELDRLLAQSEFSTGDIREASEGESETEIDPLRLSALARQENIRKLHAVRIKLADDLAGTLAWVRELVTMIHLAKFTGAPASRANELVTQIAAAVEGLSEATRLHQEMASAG